MKNNEKLLCNRMNYPSLTDSTVMTFVDVGRLK